MLKYITLLYCVALPFICAMDAERNAEELVAHLLKTPTHEDESQQLESEFWDVAVFLIPTLIRNTSCEWKFLHFMNQFRVIENLGVFDSIHRMIDLADQLSSFDSVVKDIWMERSIAMKRKTASLCGLALPNADSYNRGKVFAAFLKQPKLPPPYSATHRQLSAPPPPYSKEGQS